jgi:hypothetical protein
MTSMQPATRRLVTLGACLVVLSATLASAQDRSRYREYRIGDDLQTIADQSGVAAPVARIMPREPALLQQLEWRPQYHRGAARQADAASRVTFGFYDDQLFRIVVDYERLRTEGMTEADMVAAVSAIYGLPSRRLESIPWDAVRSERAADLLVACWEHAEHTVTLLRVPDSSAFRLIVASTRLGTLAQAAGAGPVRLDEREAPRADAPARREEIEDGQTALQKARQTNKAAFTP